MPASVPGRSKTKVSSEKFSWKTVFAILGSIAAVVGAIVSGLDFIQYLKAGYQEILWLGVVVLSLIWLIVLGLLFKQKNIYGILWLVVTILAGVIIWQGWRGYMQAREAKLIVLIARFDGPEDVYGLRNEIVEKINADFPKGGQVQIETTDEVITPEKGSQRARELGKSVQADAIIWGWYRPTENPNITIHVENFASNEFVSVESSKTFHPQTSIDELEQFKFQQKAGQQTGALISSLVGVLQYLSGDYSSALSSFNQTLTDPQVLQQSIVLDIPEIYFYRANTQSFLGDSQAAIQDYSMAIKTNPQFQGAYINRGSTYLELQEYSLALEDLTQAIELDATSALAYTDRGNIYYSLGQIPEAFADYDRALEIDPEFALAYENRGAVSANLGQYQKAISDFEKAIEIDPSDAQIYNNLGLAYAGLQEREKSVAAYEKAISINPDFAKAYNNLGTLYMMNEEYQTAIKNFDRATSLQPGFSLAHFNTGLCYAQLGDYKSSLRSYDQSIFLEPQNAIYLNNRGITYAMMGEFHLAIQDFDKAIEIEPSTMPYMNRGKAYASLGQYDLAFEDFASSILMDPSYAQVYYNRGELYQSLGKTAEAEADFAEYRKLTGQDVP